MESLQSRKRVTEFKKRKPFHLGLLFFLIIFIYVIINIVLYMTKPQISIFEVRAEDLAGNPPVKAIAVRAESIVTTQSSGYINYYLSEGSRIACEGTVYSIDENKRIYDTLADAGSPLSFLDSDIRQIKDDIKQFRKNYNDKDFSDVRIFKDSLITSLRMFTDQNIISNLDKVEDEMTSTTAFQIAKSKVAGIVSYYSDTLTGLTLEQVDASTFDQEHYRKDYLRTNELLESNVPVYRIITEDMWYLIAKVDDSLYAELADLTKVKISITKDQRTLTVPIEVYQDGQDNFVRITMLDHMLNYSNDRFLEVEFKISKESGLKIPKTAITEKQFYLVPSDFVVDNETGATSLIKAKYDSISGQVSYEYVPIEVEYEIDDMSYIDTSAFELGTILFNKITNSEYKLGATEKSDGVFNVNKGFAVFCRIERLNENEEYCIVKNDTKNGISLYDHIALDYTTVTESAIIY